MADSLHTEMNPHEALCPAPELPYSLLKRHRLRACHAVATIASISEQPRIKSDEFVCERGVRDENWRITRPARCMNYRHRMAGHAFHCADHAADRGSFPPVPRLSISEGLFALRWRSASTCATARALL